MSDDNQKTTIEKPACSGSAEAALLCTDRFKAGVFWLEQEILDFLQDTEWDDMPCSKLMEKMATIIYEKVGA